MGRPSESMMMLARLSYLVRREIQYMKHAEKHNRKVAGTTHYRLKLGNTDKRSIKVKVPNNFLHVAGHVFYSMYASVAVLQLTAAADELYVDSRQVVAFTAIDKTGAEYGGPQKFYTGPDALGAAITESDVASGWMVYLGCMSSKYTSMVPWCIVDGGDTDGYNYGKKYVKGTNGKYAFSTAFSSQQNNIFSNAGLPGIPNSAIATCSSPSPPSTPCIKHKITATVVKTAITAATSQEQRERLSCVLRHYNYFVKMFSCVAAHMGAYMMVDSGCTEQDEGSNRYGCLCRRRSKYIIMEALPEPTVSGKAIDEVFEEVETGNYSDNNGTNTENVTGGFDFHHTTTGAPTAGGGSDTSPGAGYGDGGGDGDGSNGNSGYSYYSTM
jgi:hypothetical protein